jgi:hypothetical protein
VSDQHEESERRGSLWKWGAFLVALPVLYGLSFGPLYGAVGRQWIDADTFIWLVNNPYQPLWDLMRQGYADSANGTLSELYCHYVLWWQP